MPIVRGCELPDVLLYDLENLTWYIESGKWVGPIRIIVAGEVVAANEALQDRPGLINADPYGQGWMVVLRPVDWAAAKASLIPGSAVAGPYEARMAADGFAGCGR